MFLSFRNVLWWTVLSHRCSSLDAVLSMCHTHGRSNVGTLIWFTLRVFARTQSLCWPAYEIPQGLSSLLFLSSLPPHLLLCSSHSFLLPPLREGKICHSLLMTANWWMTQWQGLSFNCDQEEYSRSPLAPEEGWDARWEQEKCAALNLKWENSWWCCLRMFWRCGRMWTAATLTLCSLPLSRSLSFFIWLLSEPAASAFEIQDAFLFFIFLLLSPLSGIVVCLNYMRTHRNRGEAFALLNWAEALPQSPEEPWEGIGVCPDTFGMALLLWSLLCSLCFVLFVLTGYVVKLLKHCCATASCVCVENDDDDDDVMLVEIWKTELFLNLSKAWKTMVKKVESVSLCTSLLSILIPVCDSFLGRLCLQILTWPSCQTEHKLGLIIIKVMAMSFPTDHSCRSSLCLLCPCVSPNYRLISPSL